MRIKICHWKASKLSNDELVELMNRIGNKFPVPLCERVNVSEYVEKLKIHGELYVVFDDRGMLGGVMGFYANDQLTRTAYLSIIGLLPHVRGIGKGQELMQLLIKNCVDAGMYTIRLKVMNSNRQAISPNSKLILYTTKYILYNNCVKPLFCFSFIKK